MTIIQNKIISLLLNVYFNAFFIYPLSLFFFLDEYRDPDKDKEREREKERDRDRGYEGTGIRYRRSEGRIGNVVSSRLERFGCITFRETEGHYGISE